MRKRRFVKSPNYSGTDRRKGPKDRRKKERRGQGPKGSPTIIRGQAIPKRVPSGTLFIPNERRTGRQRRRSKGRRKGD